MAKKTMTLGECHEMTDLLIARYITDEFQKELWMESNKFPLDNLLEQAKVRQAVCSPIQFPILEKFGFDATRKGLAASQVAFSAPEVAADPEIQKKNQKMSYWVNVSQQVAAKTDPQFAYEGIDPEKLKNPEPAGLKTSYLVVGGADTKGILVREGEGLKSVEVGRLVTSATVEEIELKGERLHFKKLTGDGPEEGWVSLTIKGKVLLEKQVRASVSASGSAKKDDGGASVSASGGASGSAKEDDGGIKRFVVVHDRIALREKPDKTSKMVGSGMKGKTFKGTVVKEGDVEWLQVDHTDSKMEKVKAFAMIDGKSVGLGTLLEPYIE